MEIRGIYGEWFQDWRYLMYKGNGQANQPILFQGSTGTGKSFMANGLFYQCAEMGDICIIPGDTTLEARHFINYLGNKVKMKFLIPKDFKFDFQVFDMERNQVSFSLKQICNQYNIPLIFFDPLKENINKFIEPHQILVVVDCCYTMPSKTKFWSYIMKQLKLRKRYAVYPLTYMFHEFGTYFPVISFKDQFKYVDEFAQHFVDFRKSYMRGICLQQFPGQSYWKIEPQFEIKVTKGANAGKNQKLDKRYGRGKRLNEYSIVWGGVEDVNVKIEGTFHEWHQIWKLIPDEEIEFSLETDEENNISQEIKDQKEMELRVAFLKNSDIVKKEFPKLKKNDLLEKTIITFINNHNDVLDRDMLIDISGLDPRTVKRYWSLAKNENAKFLYKK